METRIMSKRYTAGVWWSALAITVALVVHAGETIQARLAPSSLSNLTAATSIAAPMDPASEARFVDDFLDVADEIDPRLAQQLRSTCQLDPIQFARVLRQLGPAMGEMVRLREDDPALYHRKIRELQLEAAIESLAARIHASTRGGQLPNPALHAELNALVQAELAAKRDTQHLLLERMQAELERAQANMDAVGARFQQHVDRRMEQLIGQ
jgi:hypothetical protein